jgi:hypothetical protein
VTPELCTYFDRNYLPQGLALIRSLSRYSPEARLWVLCLDDVTQRILQKLDAPNVRLVTIDELIEYQPELQRARDDRPTVQFFYACTPRLVQFVLDAVQRASGVTYIDADMFCFGPPRSIYEEASQSTVLIVAHRSGNAEMEAENGRFNVCLVHFARDPEARKCLDWWAAATLRSTAFGDGTFGDQKYLDEFPRRFTGVRILSNPDSTLAPWNIWRHSLERGPGGDVIVDGRPLAVYHFARFLMIGQHLFMPIRRLWLSRVALELIYRPYMRATRSAYDEIRGIDRTYRVGYTGHNLRGLLLGLAAGRTIYEGKFGMHRIGVWIPSGREEWESRRRLLAAGSRVGATHA